MSQHDTHIEWLPVHSAATIACVEALARQIWTEHYVPIIGQAQVGYMLEHFQSAAAIAAQIAEDQEYFLVRRVTAEVSMTPPWCGYYAVQAQSLSARLFISKIYLLATERRQGLGRAMLQQITLLARQRGLTTLWLTVNKHNPALQVYLRWGFQNVGPIVKDIGGGFVMDDFQLEKQL